MFCFERTRGYWTLYDLIFPDSRLYVHLCVLGAQLAASSRLLTRLRLDVHQDLASAQDRYPHKDQGRGQDQGKEISSNQKILYYYLFYDENCFETFQIYSVRTIKTARKDFWDVFFSYFNAESVYISTVR